MRASRTTKNASWAVMGVTSLLTAPAWALGPFYVSTGGNDNNSGTSTGSAWRTINKARAYLRDNKGTMNSDITVYIDGGYYNEGTLTFQKFDSGTNGYKVSYKALNSGNKPIVSGATKLGAGGWTLDSGQVYRRSVPNDQFREFYQAYQWRQRARTNGRIQGTSWWFDSNGKKAGIIINDTPLLPATLTNQTDMEVHMQKEWNDYYFPVTEITPVSNGKRIIKLKQDVLQLALNMGYQSPDNTQGAYPNGNPPFFVENARELVDQPGEWYCNRVNDTLYYYPMDAASINTDNNTFIPVNNRLISMEGWGTSDSDRVMNITFDNVVFEGAGFTNPNYNGWFGWQASSVVRPSFWWGHTPGAVQMTYTKNISFTNCLFRFTGAAAIYLFDANESTRIDRNTFTDIGESPISVGRGAHVNPNDAAHLINNNVRITNNYIRRAGRNFFGAPGITCFAARNMTVDHNDLDNLPYTGIHLGWGGNANNQINNRITNNRVTNVMNFMDDGGSIYTFGLNANSWEQRAIIQGNYCKGVTYNYAGIYLDDSTAYVEAKDNVLENVPRWIYLNTYARHITATNNFSTTSNKKISSLASNYNLAEPTLFTSGNPPAAAQAIINNAGVQNVNASSNTNLLSNASFESEQYGTQTPSGWSEWSNQGGVGAGFTETANGAHSGSYHATHWSSSAYNIYTYQTKTGLSNGLYTARIRAKRGGNQSSCYFEAKDFGGTTRIANIPTGTSTGAYTLVEIRDINVTNSQCTIGIWSASTGGSGNGSWTYFDDVELFKQ